jgi:hypothetical protein
LNELVAGRLRDAESLERIEALFMAASSIATSESFVDRERFGDESTVELHASR